MAQAIIVDTLAKAVALRTLLANRLGLPRDGTDIGDGTHVPAAASRTTIATLFRRHPDGSARWAIMVPPRLAAYLDATDRASVVTLTGDWFPEALP
jgi:hypothetical protein